MNLSSDLSDDFALTAERPVNFVATTEQSVPGRGETIVHLALAEKRPGFFADILNRALGDIVEDQTPIALPETATVQAACRIMRDKRIGAILVIGEDGRLTGLFSGRDAVCRLVAEGLDPATTPLCAVMTVEPDALRPNQRASDALRMMNEGGYRHLPVVDGSRLVGIVSGGDLTAQYGVFSLPG